MVCGVKEGTRNNDDCSTATIFVPIFSGNVVHFKMIILDDDFLFI